MNFIDPFGLKPGDLFENSEQAAIDAIDYINPTSIKENKEYGGWIYKKMANILMMNPQKEVPMVYRIFQHHLSGERKVLGIILTVITNLTHVVKCMMMKISRIMIKI